MIAMVIIDQLSDFIYILSVQLYSFNPLCGNWARIRGRPRLSPCSGLMVEIVFYWYPDLLRPKMDLQESVRASSRRQVVERDPRR
jgi:hypothetical protein